MLSTLTKVADLAIDDHVGRTLTAVRLHLGMELAYVSEFVDGHARFREVDGPGLEHLLKAGDSVPIADAFCHHVLDGRLPELMRDTAEYEAAMRLPITHRLPIGAHLGVPIRQADGRVIGMFGCLRRTPDPSLTPRDLAIMRVFADLAGRQIINRIETDKRARRIRADIGAIIDETAFAFEYQPIWELSTGRPLGFEALCRFLPGPYRAPDKWFAEAAEIGLTIELELAVIGEALKDLPNIPKPLFLSLNASPSTVVSGRLHQLLSSVPPGSVVIEVTEHAPVDDYDRLTAALEPLREAGIGLAIDDAGAGYASLQHIISLKPDRIKLDGSLTRSIDRDPARRALATALVAFARETEATIIAEGIETFGEFKALRSLGVDKGQGYFLGAPAPLAEALEMRGLSVA